MFKNEPSITMLHKMERDECFWVNFGYHSKISDVDVMIWLDVSEKQENRRFHAFSLNRKPYTCKPFDCGWVFPVENIKKPDLSYRWNIWKSNEQLFWLLLPKILINITRAAFISVSCRWTEVHSYWYMFSFQIKQLFWHLFKFLSLCNS